MIWRRSAVSNWRNLDISDSTKSIEKTIKASDIKLPDGITFVKSVDKIKNIVIRANIEKKTKRTLTIPTEQIALINNTKNYDVKFDDSELKVKISGLRSVVDKSCSEGFKSKRLTCSCTNQERIRYRFS